MHQYDLLETDTDTDTLELIFGSPTDADTVHFLCISVCVCTLQIESLLYVSFTN